MILFGYGIATTIHQLESAIKSANEQIMDKLKQYHQEAEIEAYTTIISYISINPESYLAENKGLIDELIPTTNLVIVTKNCCLVGENISVRLLARVRLN